MNWYAQFTHGDVKNFNHLWRRFFLNYIVFYEYYLGGSVYSLTRSEHFLRSFWKYVTFAHEWWIISIGYHIFFLIFKYISLWEYQIAQSCRLDQEIANWKKNEEIFYFRIYFRHTTNDYSFVECMLDVYTSHKSTFIWYIQPKNETFYSIQEIY